MRVNRRSSISRLDWTALSLFSLALAAQAQDDGGVSYDNRGQELLKSIAVPTIAHAPFSLALATEWSRPMNNGGTYTIVNSRPIKRDAEGRIYEERWLLSPKGSKIPSQMSWISDRRSGSPYAAGVQCAATRVLPVTCRICMEVPPSLRIRSWRSLAR